MALGCPVIVQTSVALYVYVQHPTGNSTATVTRINAARANVTYEKVVGTNFKRKQPPIMEHSTLIGDQGLVSVP